jgi:outer membrane immunogenic protein
MRLRTTILQLAAVAGLIFGTAHGVRAQDPAWSGLYIGASAGMAALESDWRTNTGILQPGTTEHAGIFGATAGFNWQTGNWVLGIEGDWSTTDDLEVGMSNCAGGCFTKVEWLATARARAGVLVVPGTLLFVTGGGAWAEVEGFFKPAIAGLGNTETASGWTVGGGFEVKLDSDWSIKGEYLYVDLDSSSACPQCGSQNTTENELNILRAGVNYTF